MTHAIIQPLNRKSFAAFRTWGYIFRFYGFRHDSILFLITLCPHN